MTTSIDGKVTGSFLAEDASASACEAYYEINRNLKSNGFICGRITMEGSFTNGWYPDLSEYAPAKSKTDYVTDSLTGFYAIAFDPKGKLGWKTSRIVDPDGDPGYDGAQIIEVLTNQADPKYLTYLENMGISYIFAGETEIDIRLALSKLKDLFGCETLLLEGGSVINGYFQRADIIDEISLVISPVVAEKDDKPLFSNSNFTEYELIKSEISNGNVILNYKRKR